MMDHLPIYISIIFVITTFITVGFFYKAAHQHTNTLIILLIWLAFQAFVGLSNFYTVTNTMPPRFLLLILPTFITITIFFTTSRGRQYIDHLDNKTLTLLHIIRVPVEIVLFWLFTYKTIPELMTFEGRNFDILSGLSAPFIYYYGFVKKQLNNAIILIWNIVCMGLLVNIVAHAILSAPLPFQMFAFEQPNIAVLYFPFNWLPACVVPLVLFSHLVVIRAMLKSNR